MSGPGGRHRGAIGFVRAVFITGAVLDGLTLVPMLVPGVGGAMFGIAEFSPTPEYTYAMGLAAALMAGWTVLLIWGAVRPVQRRALLLFTVVPVVVGLLASGINVAARGFFGWADILPSVIIQSVIICLFTGTYIVARKLAQDRPRT